MSPEKALVSEKPQLDPHPLSPYVAWAGHRNRDPILEVLKDKLPDRSGNILELASGSGMHLHYFAPHFPHLTFQPSDLNEQVFDTIKSLTQESKVQNVRQPIKIDLTQSDTWSVLQGQKFDVMFCINIFQVAPLSIADGMMQCAANLLASNGFLFIYGPFKLNGEHTAPSNMEFDQTLRSYSVPEWGLKDVADLTQAAQKHGLGLKEMIQMPANNLGLIYGA
ncbi:DUF938 domain-containing protein [Vacuolonema iberomarrocanum]|uniref:DUF938 domain-containing protein n=1 Tax=Vacuolonema iberomarrocanum TaxID=3454632 RepID=UPI0019F479EB|nr:DUF938 domain-containing protein [filamentous cyanobacterium LEGE 07170]